MLTKVYPSDPDSFCMDTFNSQWMYFIATSSSQKCKYSSDSYSFCMDTFNSQCCGKIHSVAVESVHAEWVRVQGIFALLWAGCDLVFLQCMTCIQPLLSGLIFSLPPPSPPPPQRSKLTFSVLNIHYFEVGQDLCEMSNWLAKGIIGAAGRWVWKG